MRINKELLLGCINKQPRFQRKIKKRTKTSSNLLKKFTKNDFEIKKLAIMTKVHK